MARAPDPNAGKKHFEVVMERIVVQQMRTMVAATNAEEAKKLASPIRKTSNDAEWHKVGTPDVAKIKFEVKLMGECGNRTGVPAFKSA